MDVDYSNEFSCDSSEIGESCASEEVNVRREVNTIQPYAFEPVETYSGGEDSGSEEMVSESSSNSENTRIRDTNW